MKAKEEKYFNHSIIIIILCSFLNSAIFNMLPKKIVTNYSPVVIVEVVTVNLITAIFIKMMIKTMAIIVIVIIGDEIIMRMTTKIN